MNKSTRYFQFVEGASSKFWNVSFRDGVATVHWGRIGTRGAKQEIDYDEADKRIREKLRKGYVELSGDRQDDDWVDITAETKKASKKGKPKPGDDAPPGKLGKRRITL